MIAVLCKMQGVRPVFVPQVMNWEALAGEGTSPWSPYVRDKDHKKIMEAYYRSMAKVAKEEGVDCVSEVRAAPFERSDFVDSGHFSAQGTQRLARILAKRLEKG